MPTSWTNEGNGEIQSSGSTIVCDSLTTTGTVTANLFTTSGSLNCSGPITTSGTFSLSGIAQLTNTLTVGVNDIGHDVKFFGASSGKYMLWDESADKLTVEGETDLNGNLTTSGYHVIGTDTREGTAMLTVHGSAPSIWLTSTTNLEGGQINIKGTSGGGGGNVDYTDSKVYLDMWKTNGRIIFQAKNMTAESMIELMPDVQDASNATSVSTYIRHLGDGKICLRGSGTNSSSYDQVNIGEGGDKDQKLIFHGSAATNYIGNDATDDIFHMGTGATMGSNKKISFNTTGIGFYGTAPVAQSSAYTATTQNARNANTATADAAIQDVLQTLIADLKLTGIIG